MSRSLKKGPFIDPKLEAKVVAQAEGNKKSVIKTWSRASTVSYTHLTLPTTERV